MAQVRERPQLREHEVDERFRKIVEREGPLTEAPAGKRPIRWMQWLAAFILLAAGAAITALLVMESDSTPTSTYAADPYAEMALIEELVADVVPPTRPFVYTGSADAEMALIERLVAEYEAAHPYVADAALEMAVIDQAVRDFELRPSAYVADAYAEMGVIARQIRWGSADDYVADATAEMAVIDQAVRDFELRPSDYVPEPNLELALIEQAVLAAA